VALAQVSITKQNTKLRLSIPHEERSIGFDVEMFGKLATGKYVYFRVDFYSNNFEFAFFFIVFSSRALLAVFPVKARYPPPKKSYMTSSTFILNFNGYSA
jgi:hypothetical protein